MGEVYRARDEKLGRNVAIKVIALESSGRRGRFLFTWMEHIGDVWVADLVDGE